MSEEETLDKLNELDKILTYNKRGDDGKIYNCLNKQKLKTKLQEKEFFARINSLRNWLETNNPETANFAKQRYKRLLDNLQNKKRRRKPINLKKEFSISSAVDNGMKSRKMSDKELRDFFNKRVLPPPIKLTRTSSRQYTPKHYLKDQGPIYGNIDRYNKMNPMPRRRTLTSSSSTPVVQKMTRGGKRRKTRRKYPLKKKKRNYRKRSFSRRRN